MSDEALLEERQPLVGTNKFSTPTSSDGVIIHTTLVEDDGDDHLQGGATVMQATCNVINIFVGLGLLSMPYAIKQSGWAGLAVQVAVTCAFAVTGKLFVSCFDALPQGVPHTYPDLGEHCLGSPVGRYMVLLLTSIELIGSNTMCLIIMQKQIQYLLPDAGLFGLGTFHTATCLSLAAVLPLLALPSLRNVAFLSVLGSASTVLVTLSVAALLPLDPNRTDVQQPPAGHGLLHPTGLLQAVGIFACSVSGHSTFPAIRASMRRRASFGTVITASFASMLAVYCTVASVGFWYFGDEVPILVVGAMAQGSVYSVHPLLGWLEVDDVLAALVGMRAATAFPAVVMVLQELAVSCMPPFLTRHGQAGSSSGDGNGGLGFARAPRIWLVMLLRVAIASTLATLAYFAYDVLGNLISLVGGCCSMACSVILPCCFWLRLHRHSSSGPQRAAVASLAALGAAMLLLVGGENLLILTRKR